jgi:hypothetical protein
LPVLIGVCRQLSAKDLRSLLVSHVKALGAALKVKAPRLDFKNQDLK